MSEDINLAIEFQLDLSRASANIVGKMLKTLRQLELDLIGITAATEWKKNRIEKQLKETRILIQKYYEYASKQVSGVPALQIATASASAAVVGLGSAALMPSTEFLKAVSDDVIVQGAPLKAWWEKQSDDLTFKYTAAVRQGVVASETNQQIIRRVKDVMLTQSHHVAALVQTSTASIANAAREEVFQKNQDIIKVRRALATLDSSTCLQCAPLDGLEWEKDGTPIDHSFPMPSYPKHVRCRCVLLFRITRDPPGGKRAAEHGPISAKTTFTDWLDGLSKEKQDDILGPGRADLFRKGKITLADLTNGNGRPLTLKQLAQKYK